MNSAALFQRHRYHFEWLALAFALALVAALLAYTLARAHGKLEAEQRDRLEVQARLVEEDLMRQIDGANRALEGVRDDVMQRNRDGLSAKPASIKLMLLADAMPGISTLLALDANGTVAASSRPGLIGRNFKERDYFTTPRAGGDARSLYVSPPFKSALDSFVVVISRVVKDEHGAFAGVVTATLDPEYFRVVLGSAIYASDMRARLVHGDGRTFVSMPQVASSKAEQESAAVAPPGDDPSKLSVERSLQRDSMRMDKSLVVAVSRDRAALAAPWRADAVWAGSVYAAVALALALGLVLDQRRRSMLQRVAAAAARERQQAADRLQIALRGANLGLWELHLPTNTFVADAREMEMFGYDDPAALALSDWRKLVHPKDWPTVQGSFAAHVRGQTPAQQCEHRMRHCDGRWLWVSARATIIERDAKGGPVRMIGTHLDITESRRLDDELRRASAMLQLSEQQLREVTDNMPALVSRLDLELRFRFANRAFLDWLGLEPRALLGRTLAEVYGASAIERVLPQVHAALGGERVVYEREMSGPRVTRRVEVTLVPHRDGDDGVIGLYCLEQDITARHDAEQRRQRSEERLNLAVEASGLGLFDWDLQTDLMYHSAQTSLLHGQPPIAMTRPPAELSGFVHADDLPAMLLSMRNAVKGTAPYYETEFRARLERGGWRWIRAHGRVVERSAQGRALRLAGTYADISERKQADEHLRRLAECDTLTGLPNRAIFGERLRAALARATPQQAMALLFLDVDHFKLINDSLGHEAGDQLLQGCAARMRDGVRPTDTVARLGGDEFTIILEDLRDPDDALAVAAKLVQSLRQPFVLAGSLRQVSASIGITLSLGGESDDGAVLHRADLALYEAKRQGRDRYHCHGAGGLPPAEAESGAGSERVH